MRRRLVENDLSGVGRAVAWAEEIMRDAGLPDEKRKDAQVCLEEALANLIMHGRAVEKHKDIRVEIAADADSATIVISDRCTPFDAAAATAQPPASLEGESVGGQGLRLLRALANGLRYRSSEGGNALTMTFAAKPDKAAC